MPKRTHPVPNPALHVPNRALAVSIGPTNEVLSELFPSAPFCAILQVPSPSLQVSDIKRPMLTLPSMTHYLTPGAPFLQCVSGAQHLLLLPSVRFSPHLPVVLAQPIPLAALHQ